MDYKEKYEQGLECLEEILNSGQEKIKMTLLKERLQPFFPELKESEDERIRGAIIDHLKDYNLTEWAAWLEKQGEMDMESYKTAEDEKREFVGDGFIKCYADFQDFKEGKTYWLEKRDEQKHVNDTVETIVEAVSNTSILDMIEDKDAFTDPGAFENSLGRLLKLFEKLPKQDLLDGLKFYANVVEHDGEYVKPAEWSDEDEEMLKWTNGNLTELKEQFGEKYGKVGECISWLKSLKERLS